MVPDTPQGVPEMQDTPPCQRSQRTGKGGTNVPPFFLSTKIK